MADAAVPGWRLVTACSSEHLAALLTSPGLSLGAVVTGVASSATPVRILGIWLT